MDKQCSVVVRASEDPGLNHTVGMEAQKDLDLVPQRAVVVWGSGIGDNDAIYFDQQPL